MTTSLSSDQDRALERLHSTDASITSLHVVPPAPTARARRGSVYVEVLTGMAPLTRRIAAVYLLAPDGVFHPTPKESHHD